MRGSFARLLVYLASGLFLVTAQGAGAPLSQQVIVPLRLTAPSPVFRPAEGASGVVASIAGFGQSSRPDEPAHPVRVLLIAIPERGVPELEILRARSEALTGIDLAPVPRVRVRERLGDARGSPKGVVKRPAGDARRSAPGVEEYDEEFRRRRDLYTRDAEFPAAPVRLGGTGYLRQQRFVEVLYTPLLYNPVRKEAHFYREVEATVRVRTGEEPPEAGSVPEDPLFEETYAASLVNYEQGKLFRVASGTAGPEPGALTEAASPATPRFKLLVSRRGVYRLDRSYLATNAPPLVSVDPRTLYLEVEGVEVPIAVRNPAGGSGESDGQFDPGDYLEFFGKSRTEAATVLNFDFGTTFPDIYQANDFTDTQVYWLQAGGNPGSHLRIPATSGAPGSPGFPQAVSFEETVVWDENNFFLPLGPADPYFSLPSLLAGSGQAQRDVGVALPGIAPVAATASLTVRLRGGTNLAADPDHRTIVSINADSANAADFTWDGEIIHEQQMPLPQALLTDPVTVHLQAPGQPEVTVDRQYLDTLTFRYQRTFDASGEVLTFTYPNVDVRFRVGGLGSVAPVVYEIGRAIAANGESDPIQITGALPGGAPTSQYTFEVARDTTPQAPTSRTFVVAGPGGLLTPDAVAQASDAILHAPDQAADLIVIATPQTVDASPGGALDALLQHRQAQGLSSRVVFIEQIYDEFSFGRRDANAVRVFLEYAFDNWRGPAGTDAPPSFALLVGDATLDYKNQLAFPGWVDQVPTPIMLQQSIIIGYYSSDNYLASFKGADQVPDIYLGRISTRTAAESAAVFDKIRLYETTPAPGVWKGRAVLVASDERISGEAASFQAINDDLEAAYFSQPPFSVPDPPLYYAEPPWSSNDPAGFKAALLSQMQAGAAALVFNGHGNFDTWGLDTFMTTQDALGLTNGLKLPFMLHTDCLSGGFHYLVADGALGEAFVNNPAGGAVAAVTPSGLSNSFIGEVVAQELFKPLFGPAQGRVLGAATGPMRAALWARGSIVDLQSYTFLGDPATVLATPAPPAPGQLSAVASSGQVDLSWTVPSSPATTRLYRAAVSPGGAYTAIACTPTGPTACRDTGVVNATRYYYYAVSVDAEGYEGPATNLNTDCDAGPDCVTALPINPGPPSVPTGFAAMDAGVGGRLKLSWNPNPENDIKRYTVYYGDQQGVYASSVTAAPAATSLDLVGLEDGVRYYMVLSATNTSGHESARTDPPISEVPHLIQGIAPPRAISDLSLAPSGNDIILSWSRPVVDIYGRPTTVVGYKVYLASTPNFQVTGMTPLATIGNGATTTFVHVEGLGLPGNGFYVVTAADAAGFVSGAGRDLPNGIGDLAVTLVSQSTVQLNWSAVTTDVAGYATIIDHYQIHRTSTPVPRQGLGPGTLALDNVTDLSVPLTAAGAANYISIIAVDNHGNLSPF